MGLFSTIQRIVDDARVAMSYPAFENNARAMHQSAAERRFSTLDLAREVQGRMADSMRIVESRFNVPIAKLQSCISDTQQKIDDHQEVLNLFLRDFDAELDALYKTKADIFEKIGAVKTALDSAYSDFSVARDGLQRWYAKSERYFFGNSGRKLPNYSFFGQILGDRDSLRFDRDAAKSAIDGCKRERADLHCKLADVNEQINAVKSDRQRMSTLRCRGESKQKQEKAMQLLHGLLSDAEQDRAQLQVDRTEFVSAAKHRTGTVALETRIAEIEALRCVFLASFDSIQTENVRRAKHRREWQISHGRNIDE